MTTTLHYATTGPIAEITLDRPPANALTLELVQAVIAALDRAAADPDVKAVVIASAIPGLFSGGLDLRVVAGLDAEAFRPLLNALYVDLAAAQARLGKPSIAAIEGPARAGGLTLALSCDMVIAGRGATFGYPEIQVGLIPAIHFRHLPRIAGRHRAFDHLFGAAAFDAVEAERLGLISRLVDDGQALPAAREAAQALAAKPADALAMGRAAFREANDQTPAELAAAVDAFCAVAATPTARAAVADFFSRSSRRRPGSSS